MSIAKFNTEKNEWRPRSAMDKLLATTAEKLGVTDGKQRHNQKPRHQWVSVSDINHDETYQRKQSSLHIGQLLATWNDDACDAPVVYQNKDVGKYYVLDGGHRVAALIASGAKKIYCRVIRNYTRNEAAGLFLLSNCTRKPLSPQEKFWAALTNKNEAAIEIKRILDGFRCEIPHWPSTGTGTIITCPDVVLRIYNVHGSDGLSQVIQFICDVWPDTEDRRMEAGVFKGVWYLILSKPDEYGPVDLEKMKACLRKIPVETVIRTASAIRIGSGVNLGDSMALAMIKLFKKYRRGQSRLAKIGE